MATFPKKHIQIIVTLGPSTSSERDLRLLKEKGVDFVRLNMSHSSTAQLRASIRLAKKVGIPFIVDTEGSQVRTGPVQKAPLSFQVGEELRLYAKPVMGTKSALTITPSFVVPELLPGDLLYCDFDSLVLCVSDVASSRQRGYVTARVISGGTVGSNKGVYIDPGQERPIHLPPLSKKDLESIRIGLQEKVGHIAASFMRSGEAVKEVRKLTKGRMQIISKVECIDGLRNLDGIIHESDMLLIDRGDLSKEIFVSRIPLTQKIIVHRARKKGKPVIVATNFLESMVHNGRPTRAEVHDIESSITDGAAGLTLAAETAIGKHPMECVNVMRSVIDHVTSAIDVDKYAAKEGGLVSYLEKEGYLLDFEEHSSLIPPHGGVLVDRVLKERPSAAQISRLPKIMLSPELQMDVEQIAVGAYSPLQGFMGRRELSSVLKAMRLPNGIAWPLPIVLDVSEREASSLRAGRTAVLLDGKKAPLALLHVSETYVPDRKDMARRLYGTLDEKHPGVRRVLAMNPVFLAGKIDLIKRRESETAFLELTPRQTRRLFEDKGWSRVVGFHTRNVIHRSHEFIQLNALERSFADGLFIHPVVGKKKKGDFNQSYILKSYDLMIRKFYPQDKALFGAFATYSRYAGPREALFTALVRQNFGCSHFVVGRDHTGVGDFYKPTASHEIFDAFPDLLIKPVRFGQVFYSKKLKTHVHEHDDDGRHATHEKHAISGTQARELFEKGKRPPAWFMRPEISELIVRALKRGEEVFVKE